MNSGVTYGYGQFKLYHAGSLDVEPPEWLVRGIVETGCTAEIFGDPGTYKSFVALDMAACIATGTPFFGHEVRRGPVVYVAGEGQRGIRRRLRAWEIVSGETLENAPLYVSGGPTALTDAKMVQDTIDAIDEACGEGPPALLVVDTLARNIGGDEQSTVDTGLMFRHSDEMRERWGCAVLYVHHSGHGAKDRGRGSSNIRASMDIELQATKDADDVMRLTSTKTKDATPMQPMAFTLHQVDLGIMDEYGAPVTSAVLRSTEYVPAKKGAPSGKHQTRFLEVLHALEDEAVKNVTDSGRDREEAHVPLSKLEEVLKGPARNCPEDRISTKYWQRIIDTLSEKQLISISGPHIASLDRPSSRSHSRSHVPVSIDTGEHWEHLRGSGRVPKREKGNGLGTMGTPEGTGPDIVDFDAPDDRSDQVNGLEIF
jgi:RecA/RadA recombinase